MGKQLLSLLGFFLLELWFADGLCQRVQMTPQYGDSVLSVAREGTSLLAGMDNGLFLSTDNGAMWSATSLSSFAVRAIYVVGGKFLPELTMASIFLLIKDQLGFQRD